jgi:hypothetical protein
MNMVMKLWVPLYYCTDVISYMSLHNRVLLAFRIFSVWKSLFSFVKHKVTKIKKLNHIITNVIFQYYMNLHLQ